MRYSHIKPEFMQPALFNCPIPNESVDMDKIFTDSLGDELLRYRGVQLHSQRDFNGIQIDANRNTHISTSINYTCILR